jgi:hypothetical protein
VLVDRLLQDSADWVTPELVESLRVWRGAEPHTQLSIWKQIPRLCDVHSVRIHGKFDGARGAPDARAARRALALFRKLGKPDAIILVRDADKQLERLDGLRQARSDGRHGVDPTRVALGLAIPEREAWHLLGFVPKNDEENQRLAQERQRLGFDPTREPHRLRGNAKRNAKPVLDKLTDNDPERERQCLADLPLDGDDRCEGCGLGSFLGELRERVIPVFV